MKVEFIPCIMIMNIHIFYEHTNRIEGRRHLLTLNMKHPVWNLLMLHKVRTRTFLKIGGVCAFQFVITRIARFLQFLVLIPYSLFD